MNKPAIFNTLSRSLHKTGFKIRKHSPEILIVTGVVGTVASAVMACVATTKVDTVLEKTKNKVDEIHDAAKKGYIGDGKVVKVEYTEKDEKKDLAIVYAHTALDFVKLYGPSVILGGVSIGCILTSHNIIRKRNLALAAAYTTLDNGFKDYRGRVIERFGKELDRELKYNIKAKEVEEIVVDEKGEEKVVKKTIQVANPQYSAYARCFDETCAGWDRNAEYNLMFLHRQQDYANELLKSQGYLFLNDVYKMLGMQVSQAGQAVGWIYDEKCPNGDNFVDFGIYDLYNEQKRNFVNGYEKSIWLDFNVDGVIWDRI